MSRGGNRAEQRRRENVSRALHQTSGLDDPWLVSYAATLSTALAVLASPPRRPPTGMSHARSNDSAMLILLAFLLLFIFFSIISTLHDRSLDLFPRAAIKPLLCSVFKEWRRRSIKGIEGRGVPIFFLAPALVDQATKPGLLPRAASATRLRISR